MDLQQKVDMVLELVNVVADAESFEAVKAKHSSDELITMLIAVRLVFEGRATAKVENGEIFYRYIQA